MQKILLTIAYDGTNYAGWQRQENAIAVQQRVEEALTRLLCPDKPAESITVKAASRTDAGVHALGQRAAFTVPKLLIPVEKLPQVLSAYLPQDVSVVGAEEVALDFDPQFCAVKKTYEYKFYAGVVPCPLMRRYSAFVPIGSYIKAKANPPDADCLKEIIPNINAMKKAARFFMGRHDFKAFCATGGSAKTSVREIFDCEVKTTEQAGVIIMSVTGSGFLYNMVRIIAGTVLYAGLGKLSPDNIPAIIESCDRQLAGKTMPPQGLTLVSVEY